MSGWIGVDLDGTLAEYGGWQGADHIGAPVPAMVERVKQWLVEDREVRIFTARCSGDGVRVAKDIQAIKAVEAWCEKHIGKVLEITCQKDYGMIELWDDRCVHVEANTGRILG